MNKDVQKLFRLIIQDIGVELKDEFDLNFERQAFFSEKWQRRKSPIRNEGRAILTDSGDLRSSIGFRSTDNSITFFSNLPYAGIHNEGGEIVVTRRMKMFFRRQFYNAAKKAFERKKKNATSTRSTRRRGKLTDGGFYAWTRDMELTPEAEFWRAMALMKEGNTIKIPRRRFLGYSDDVEKQVREIIEKNLNDYFDVEYKINKQ